MEEKRELTFEEHLARMRDRLANELKTLTDLKVKYPEHEYYIETINELLTELIEGINEIIEEIISGL